MTINDGAGDILTYDGISSAVGTTAANPIKLKIANEKLSDVKLYVPINLGTLTPGTNTFEATLLSLIGPPNNYWGDDDGDSNPTITPIGASLKAEWEDKFGTPITDPNHVFKVCGEPYSVTLTSTATAILSTEFGSPNSSTFTGGSKTYYIESDSDYILCGARPDMTYSRDVPPTFYAAGPATEWHVGNPVGAFGSDGYGFLPQASGRNFPTTGANNLYFDLMIGGGDASNLTWKVNGIVGSASDKSVTVKVETYTSSPDKESKVKVKLTGPHVLTLAAGATATSAFGGSPTNPAKFKIEGFRGTSAVISYSFGIEKWYINRANGQDGPTQHGSWCAGLIAGGVPNYTLAKVRDLSNSNIGPIASFPLSPVIYYQRRIGGGLFTEWGNMSSYGAFFYSGVYFTLDPKGGAGDVYVVSSLHGGVYGSIVATNRRAICVSQ